MDQFLHIYGNAFNYNIYKSLCPVMVAKLNYNLANAFKIFIVFLIMQQMAAVYSPYFKRCRIHKGGVDADAIPIQDLQLELFPYYPEKHMSKPVINPEIEINYTEYDYYFHQFIDSGGSGEVFLLEDITTGEGKVAKRYFQERHDQFRRENYLMKELNYPISWTKYCKGVDKCSEEDTDYYTVSIFPHKDSIVFRTLEFEKAEAPLLFYKILKELDKVHRAGIIHNDIKMGNLLFNSIGPNFKFYEVQFIDWNLALFYHTGLDTNSKKGTVCFYSPQQLLRTQYVTPARDIWALGVAVYTYFTGEKPFAVNCKKDNLKAIASLIGAEKLLALNKRYNYNSIEQLKLLKELQAHGQRYPERDLYNIGVRQNQQSYTKDLVDVFNRMFEPDPQKRATAAQLLKMKYFHNLTTLPEVNQEPDQKTVKSGKPKTAVKSKHSDQKSVS